MFRGLMQTMSYSSWLSSEKANHKRAIDSNLKTCQKCGFCCLIRPCIPTPDELRKIAKFLNLPVKEAVAKYFVVDSLNSTDKFIFPAKTEQSDITGKYIPSDRTYDRGYCVFFDNVTHDCKIHNVLPKHAKLHGCWESNEVTEKATADAVSSWRGVNMLEFVVDESCLTESDNYDDYWDD